MQRLPTIPSTLAQEVTLRGLMLGVTTKDSESLRSTLCLVVVFPHVLRAFLCGKTTTNIRVNAAVNDYLFYRPLGAVLALCASRQRNAAQRAPRCTSLRVASRHHTRRTAPHTRGLFA